MDQTITPKLHKLALACGIALAFSAQQAAASGFAVPELSVSGMAQSNAVVANHKDLGAIAYNPAAMAFHEGGAVSLGGLLVKPNLGVTTGNGSFDSESNDIVAIPSISAHYQMNEDWSIGLSVNAPFGLETDWLPETFAASASNPGGYPLGETMPTNTKLEIVAFSPSVSYMINDNFSVAGGIDLYWMKEVLFNASVNDGGAAYPAVEIEGDGRGAGLNISGLYVMNNWSFGGSFHSAAKIPIDGTIALPPGSPVPGFASNNVVAELEIPYRLQIGVRNQTTEKLALEFDITRTGWSSFDTLVVDNKELSFINYVSSENKWKDVNAYRFGASYDLTGKTQLRAGYTFDETPQGDDYFSPRVPDADRHLFSFGAGHQLGDGWSIDAGYMYVQFQDRTPTATTHANGETNGTSAVVGDYESSVHLFGFGVNKTFM